jgi:hypothetical protein
MRATRRSLLLAAAVLAAALAACGSPAAPLTARELAAKIPGCAQAVIATPSVMEVQDVTCVLQDGAYFDIGTFASKQDEREWITDGGSPDSPDPAYPGCCIQGNGWAATVGLASYTGPMTMYLRQVVRALGGRIVNG